MGHLQLVGTTGKTTKMRDTKSHVESEAALMRMFQGKKKALAFRVKQIKHTILYKERESWCGEFIMWEWWRWMKKKWNCHCAGTKKNNTQNKQLLSETRNNDTVLIKKTVHTFLLSVIYFTFRKHLLLVPFVFKLPLRKNTTIAHLAHLFSLFWDNAAAVHDGSGYLLQPKPKCNNIGHLSKYGNCVPTGIQSPLCSHNAIFVVWMQTVPKSHISTAF